MVVTAKATGKVLIVEDNVLNLDMASELLNIAGFETYQAENANTGIAMAKRVKPDIILMDLHMPHQDGFSATQLLKQDPQLKDIPVVAFTALAMREDQEKAFSAGCVGVISKPIDVNRFAETVRSYLIDNMQEDGDNHHFAASVPNQPQLPLKTDEFVTPARVSTLEGPSSSNKEELHIKPQPATDYTGLTPIEAEVHDILVVDDNPMNVELLKDALESMGQNVIPAYNGYAALAAAKEHQPDLVLLDIMMPDLDGYGVLAALKEHPRTADIPVIFISALNKTQDKVRGFQQGTYDYITKPFKVEEVKARVLATLRIKDLQDSLRSERDKLNVIFQYSADGIALLDRHLNVISANPLFARWFNLSLSAQGQPSESANLNELLRCQCAHGLSCLLHTPGASLISPSSEAEKLAVTSDSSVTEAEETAPAEAPSSTVVKPFLVEDVILTDAQGQNQYLNIHVGPVLGAGNSVQGYVVVIRDVTKEKTIEQSKETFVATLTHDLKTPIRAEYRALQLLQDQTFGPMSSEQQEILGEIIHSNRYMASLVDSLLTTYKYEEGKMELKPESTDINALIQDEIATSLKMLAEEKGVHFVLKLGENLPPVWIDGIEIQRVLNNLVQNAITHTPVDGTITVSTQQRESFIHIRVEDTGRGIPAEDLEAIFDRYKTMAKQFKQVGTGLGLYLSKMIIEAHGGRIDVESEVGKGSCFCFDLPVVPDSERQAD
jgi:CheY-like chemotaxis protein